MRDHTYLYIYMHILKFITSKRRCTLASPQQLIWVPNVALDFSTTVLKPKWQFLYASSCWVWCQGRDYDLDTDVIHVEDKVDQMSWPFCDWLLSSSNMRTQLSGLWSVRSHSETQLYCLKVLQGETSVVRAPQFFRVKLHLDRDRGNFADRSLISQQAKKSNLSCMFVYKQCFRTENVLWAVHLGHPLIRDFLPTLTVQHHHYPDWVALVLIKNHSRRHNTIFKNVAGSWFADLLVL